MVAPIFPDSVTYFEELVFDADPSQDLHFMLDTPGGDPETTIRILRSARQRCRELTIVIPDSAKSAGTLLALGADHVMMGPVSDLGPVDPQLLKPDGSWMSAKDLISAVDRAMDAVQAAPDTYPLHASMLADITAVMVEEARNALARTDELLVEALGCHPGRTDEQIKTLAANLGALLVREAKSHGAVFDAQAAERAGLPVIRIDPRSRRWQMIWRLWTKYLVLVPFEAIYEGANSSQVRRIPAG